MKSIRFLSQPIYPTEPLSHGEHRLRTSVPTGRRRRRLSKKSFGDQIGIAPATAKFHSHCCCLEPEALRQHSTQHMFSPSLFFFSLMALSAPAGPASCAFGSILQAYSCPSSLTDQSLARTCKNRLSASEAICMSLRFPQWQSTSSLCEFHGVEPPGRPGNVRKTYRVCRKPDNTHSLVE